MSWPTKVAGRTGIYRHPNGKHAIHFRDAAGLRWRTVGTLEEAERTRAEIKALAAKGIHLPRNRTTLAELADEWLGNLERSSGTIARYRRVVERQIKPAAGRLRVCDIDSVEIARFHSALVVDGLRESTRALVHTVLRQLLASARDKNIYVYEVPASEEPERNTRARPFTADELARLLQNAESQWRPAFQLAVATGTRTSELLAFRFEDVEGETIGAERYIGEDGTLTEIPRTNSRRRTISVAGDVLSAVTSQLDTQAGGYLFPGKGGPRTPRAFNIALKRAAERAGIQEPQPRSLRDTFVADQLGAGVDLKALSEQLGYTSFEMFHRAHRSLIHAADRTLEAHNPLRDAFREKRVRKKGPATREPIRLQRPGGPRAKVPLTEVERRTGHPPKELLSISGVEGFVSEVRGVRTEMLFIPEELLRTPKRKRSVPNKPDHTGAGRFQ